ncbi:MAG: ABC transporter ATP-binding protein [Defluviitaleaceae bacterium]|nr:ABC transporter ATP-binding protein [Defluviitaleaceae bacterium]
MIQLKNVCKKFDNHLALNNLNLNVKKGSIYGLVGVNGSGKTTAIKHIAGVFRQNSGQVEIGGLPVYDNTAIKAIMGYIPDDLYTFPNYNLRGLRNFYANLYRNWNENRYNKLLKLFKLDEKRRVQNFSKGMKKQVAFILTMSTMPEVLLLDEPIDGLDPIVRQQVLKEIIADVAERQMTVLISSHNLKELDGICDSIGIIKNGTMLVENELDSLKSDLHKIQVAFPSENSKNGKNGENGENGQKIDKFANFEILHKETRGQIELLVIRGNEEQITAQISQFSPILYDKLTLSLEEIFMYEYQNEEIHNEIGNKINLEEKK